MHTHARIVQDAASKMNNNCRGKCCSNNKQVDAATQLNQKATCDWVLDNSESESVNIA